MSDNILTKPLLQNAELITLAPRTIVLQPNVWAAVLGTQVLRMSATVLRADFANPVVIANMPVGAGVLPTATLFPYPLHIHAAEWPLEITGPWYCFSNVLQAITILETLRFQEG